MRVDLSIALDTARLFAYSRILDAVAGVLLEIG